MEKTQTPAQARADRHVREVHALVASGAMRLDQPVRPRPTSDPVQALRRAGWFRR